MSKVADTENISIGANAGKVGADNAVDVKGKSESVYIFCQVVLTVSLNLFLS